MEIINKWCLENNMLVNHDKCELLLLNKNKDKLVTTYQPRDKIKYLGVTITNKLSLKEHYVNVKKNVNFMCHRLMTISTNKIMPTRLIQLFFVILKSTVDYGSVIFPISKSKTLIEDFAILIRNSFKKCLRLKQSTSILLSDEM